MPPVGFEGTTDLAASHDLVQRRRHAVQFRRGHVHDLPIVGTAENCMNLVNGG